MAESYPTSLYDRGFERPHFADRDPQAITAAVITEMEQLLERQLFPAQIERLLANLQAYREVGVRQAIQWTGEQNLVAFATGIHLDYLGELVGCYRLGAAPAMTRLRFTLSRVPDWAVVVPEGTTATRGRGAGQIHWRTVRSARINGAMEGGSLLLDEDGLPYVEVEAQASTHGVIGNGFQPGEINALVTDPFPWFKSVENVVISRQGAATESDDRYRHRIMLAPEQLAGGSEGAYQYAILSLSPYITDVAVVQDSPGHITVLPLTHGGLPTPELLAQASKALRPDRRRPLTDWVSVAAPVEVPLHLHVTVTPYTGRNGIELEQRLRAELDVWMKQRNPVLGVDFVPSQVCGAIAGIAGVYRVEVTAPAYRVIAPNEWAHYTGLTLTMAEPQSG
ncbi:MAG: baseplate J/gp47 family protein [Spirulina sp.]